MESAICVRGSSNSPPASLVAPVAVKPNLIDNQPHSTHLATQTAAAAAALEQQRIQQIYQIALAERIRLASGLSWPRPYAGYDNGSSTHQIHSHPTLNSHPSMLAAAAAAGHGYIYPWRFVDPRSLYRVPEEPKPQHSYIGLIAMAILSSPDKKLVLSDIYGYILDNYAYFRSRGPGWRNSIRHNLSLNDCFMKAGRSANGKGHYWAIHPANINDFARGDFRRRRAQRRVRKHLGLQVDDDSSPEPPPISPLPNTLTEHPIHPLNIAPTSIIPRPRHSSATRKRQFDVASLLAPDDDQDDSTIFRSRRFRAEIPSPQLSVPNNSRNGSPNTEIPLKLETRGNSPNTTEEVADEVKPWPSILGWPQTHSWTILTPPQEDADLLRSTSKSPSK